MEPATATLIGTGVAAAASGVNMGFQGSMNKKTRRFAEKMYKQQYQDELNFWRMNNAYNHPTAQMERLRNAGLNPHLVYGKGTVGNSSSAPSAPSQPRWEGTPPQMDTGIAMAGLDQYYNLEAKKAQTDNLRAQNTLLQKEASLKSLGILQNAFDLDMSYETKQAVIGKAFSEWMRSQEQTATEAQRGFGMSQENQIRERLMKAGIYMDRAKAGIENLRVDTGNKRIDTQLKNLDLMLWDQGISRTDPMWMRVMYQFARNNNLLDAEFDTSGINDAGKKVGDYWKKNVGSKYKNAYDYIRKGIQSYY